MTTIKKTLLMLLPAVSLLFGSCLGGGDSQPDPMAPGISIYNMTRLKNQLTLAPADAAVRLAILLAEAEENGLSAEEALTVTAPGSDRALRDMLFSPSDRIECEGTAYTLTLSSGIHQNEPFGAYDGRIVIETNGQHLDREGDEWTVSISGFKAYVSTGYSSMDYNYTSGTTTLSYNSGGLKIRLSNFEIDTNGRTAVDGWSGTFDLGMAGLAFSACDGGTFTMNGTASDNTLLWRATNVRYKGETASSVIWAKLLSGEIYCRFQSGVEYDPETYPSDYVMVEWSNNGQSYTMTYNGMTASR